MTHPIDSEDLPTNPSHNEHFQRVVERAVNRRGFLLKTGVGAAAVGFLSAGLTGCGGGGSDAPVAGGSTPPAAGPLLGFTAIPTDTGDRVTVAPGYTATVLAPWGTPLFSTGPGATWVGDGSEDAAAQARQMGDNHDGIHYFAINGKSDEGLLVMNHEYTNLQYLFTNGVVDSLDDANKDLNAHGVAVVHVKRTAGTWAVVVDSAYNRRITGNTLMQLTGPAAGDALLQTSADPTGTAVFGTLNNCGNGWTPWGTYLTCEENFNQYFGTTNTANPGQTRDANMVRYGLSSGTTSRKYEQYFDRFDWQKEPNEANRFGWIVEIDPFDVNATPKKRTALGRIKHENAAYAIAADGRVVVYMGDDQANDYVYKFVSTGRYIAGDIVNNRNLLDSGTLYVAKFNDGATTGDMMGTGEWLPLTAANPALSAFSSQADILVRTRQAADALGATPMDRPEWVTVHPQTREVYVTLTNNSGRATTNDANPRTGNVYGQIVRWREAGNDPTALTFEWDIFVLAGNPTIAQANPLNNGSSNVTVDNTFNSPDGLGFDNAGRLWIQTDGNYSNTGNYANQGNNQMLCADPVTKEIRRFLVGPVECEVTGLTFTPDSKTLFINIQHPGEGGNSHWPAGGTARPRSATLVITKNDGGVIGT
ncbi:PhoX family protein [Hydrogenophaga crocea]|uniref:PhoX family phosphatase n=1 Tax=Hydrogenophaga crocea TaxID=2716225 RepID=A0A6G8IHF6_9BURK|nr:PhoX family phosphatase [Hydrogenophaga crocea]QIM52583.1 PhoX family phosphatase [Hydrogenophaga crocea]